MSFPEDRVSALPDSILTHILSFLHTKSSVATTILSKRWNPLWLSVLDLYFDNQTFKDFITFRHAVSSVILSREVTLPIRSFGLRYSDSDDGYDHDHNDINLFINAVLKRGIENLYLHFSRKLDKLKLTSNVFGCKTLTVLKLKKLYVNDVPDELHFPLLKILVLHKVYFMCCEDVFKFVLGCPVLEGLQTYRLLHLHYWKSFSYANCVSDIVKGKCLSNLIRAKISENLSIPLILLSSAHALHVKLRCPHPAYLGHTFHNLTQMELFFYNYGDNIWTGKWMWMQEVLQHSPKLQRLTIHQEIENVGINEAYWEDPQIVPQCLSSQLKTFLFRGCRGKNSELQFVEYIMQNSKVLRTMTIYSASSIDLNAKHEMLKKLAVCPRNCKLIFD